MQRNLKTNFEFIQKQIIPFSLLLGKIQFDVHYPHIKQHLILIHFILELAIKKMYQLQDYQEKEESRLLALYYG